MFQVISIAKDQQMSSLELHVTVCIDFYDCHPYFETQFSFFLYLFMSFFLIGYAQYFELYKHYFCNSIFPMPARQYVLSVHIVQSDSMIRD